MKNNNNNDIIDIPTELDIESIEAPIESLDDSPIETLTIEENIPETNLETQNIATTQNVTQPEEISPVSLNESKNYQENTNNELQQISLNNKTEPIIESIDGNPEVLDMEVKGLTEENKPKSKKGIKIILIVALILIVLGGSFFAYYKFFYNKPVKTNENNELQIKNLKTIASFEEAYQRKEADFKDSSSGVNTIYTIKEGNIIYSIKGTEIKLHIEKTYITKVSYLDTIADAEIIAIQDEENNYYFAHIDKNINEDMALTKENSNLIKIDNSNNITNVAIAKYLHNDDIFYLALRNGTNYYITVNEDSSTSLEAVFTKVYNGINIDFSWLNIAEKAKEKLTFDGIGLYYDGALYFYEGPIEGIKEIEVKNNNDSMNCKEIFVAYEKGLKYFDLYIVTSDDYLYKINLLNLDINGEIDLEKFESKISEYTILQSDIAHSADINFENGESIKLK